MVSFCTMASSDASVSRCSLSQARVNFMPRPSHAWPCPAASWSDDSRAQSSRQRREVERPEAIVREPADVGLEERPQVGHAVFQHGDAVDPETPGEALHLVRVEPAVLQHVRMNHAAAEDFHPIIAFAEAHLALVALTLDVDLERWFGERKVRRPEPHLHAIDLKERLAELFEDPLQMAKMRALVDHQALDLMEHRRVGLVAVAAIGAAGDDDPDWRLLLEHRPDL